MTETTSVTPGIKQRIQDRWNKVQKVLPAVAFLGGFIWDSVTMGKVVQSSDLWILTAYYLVAFVALYFVGRDLVDPWLSRVTWVIQFCFGSLFSALVIFYFKSSGNLMTLGFVIILIVLLVGNELIQSKYSKLTVAWSLFTLSGAMYLNFFLPHMIHSVGFIWFLISTLIAFAMTYALWKLSKNGPHLLVFPILVVIGLLGAYLIGAIPPVPMVLKQNIVCKGFEKINGEYTCLEPDQSLFNKIGLSPFQIYGTPEEKVYVLSSVFGPSGVEAELEHRWMYLDPRSSSWQYRGTVPFRMVGGRMSGWRLYSNKQGIAKGTWRVITALKGGAAMGYVQFEVPAENEVEGVPYSRKILH